ncbi:MAG: ATPase domain-containing protein [Chthoniobacteraceae bacterium]
MSKILRTNVSQAYWCSPGETPLFEQAIIPKDHEAKPSHVAWLDRLFDGGLRIPEGGKPLILLIAGPPGSGKSTLALEMCYRMVLQDDETTRGLFSLFLSTDAEAVPVINNAVNLWGPEAEARIVEFSKGAVAAKPTAVKSNVQNSIVCVRGRGSLEQQKMQNEMLKTFVHGALETLGEWSKIHASDFIKKTLQKFFHQAPAANLNPDVLVVDSLNILSSEDQAEYFQSFLAAVPSRTKLVIFVLDSGGKGDSHKVWEYVSDIVVRLDDVFVKDYYVRTIQVVKARYQSHTWGRHQVKVYPAFNPPAETDPDRRLKLRRAHPYRSEGGIFIYPSIHSYLSAYKHRGRPSASNFDETPLPHLNDLLGPGPRDTGGFPKGRCTAFIGQRGGHKSHLGYSHLLHRIVSKGEAGLVISLRDDGAMTRRTMGKILSEIKGAKPLESYEKNGQLEVLYFHPGYITPEEFFHRVFLSVHRIKHLRHTLTVLFNSLDQLEARFPLCAEQQIFIPGIIEFLSGEGATSIFIAVAGADQPEKQYGLLPMADLILSFQSHTFQFEEYKRHLASAAASNGEPAAKALEKRLRCLPEADEYPRTEVVLEVERFAGGERAGARGILELVVQPGQSLHASRGLHFTPLDSHVPYRKRTDE